MTAQLRFSDDARTEDRDGTGHLQQANVVAIAAGAFHRLALKRDGTVVGWGDNTFKQAAVPAGLRDVVAVTAGYSHNVALRMDGTVLAWGNNIVGQTNVPPGLNNVVSISAGGDHTLALKRDGSVRDLGIQQGRPDERAARPGRRDRVGCF